MLAAAVARVEECRGRRIWATERPVVTHVRPVRVLPLSQDRHGGVVGMDALGRKHMRPDRFDQRHQRCPAGTDPVGKRRHIEIDALAGVCCTLAVERQVQSVLREQDIGEQVGARPRAAESLVPQLGDRVLEPLDQQRAERDSVSSCNS